MRIQFAVSGNDQCCALHQALQKLFHALHDNQPEKENVIMQFDNAWPDIACLCVCVCRLNFNVYRIEAKLMQVI